MALSRVWLSILSVCTSLCLSTDSVSPALPVVLGAVGKVIKYYEKNFQELNLDGLFGLRVIEGQLELLTDGFKEGQFSHVPKEIVEAINHYHVISSKVSDLGLEAARKDDPEYFDSMAYVVAYPWTFQNPHRTILPSLKWENHIYKQSSKIELKESTSDACMGELTGNSKLQKKGCQISQECINIMTHRGLTQYGITHQLLWTMLGEKAGCKIDLDEALTVTSYHHLEGLRLEMCTNNYFEMKELTDQYLNKTIIPKFQDLFLEQQFVCANLGFGQFLSLEYLEVILSWQKRDGCFGKMQKVKHKVNDKLEAPILINPEVDNDYDYEDYTDIKEQYFKQKHVEAMEKKLKKDNLPKEGRNLQFHGHDRNVRRDHLLPVPDARDAIQRNQNVKRKLLSLKEIGENVYLGVDGPRRKLLVEKEMFGGCLSHKTAVAAGALVMYLRYLIDPGETGLDKGNVKLVDPGKKRDILQKGPNQLNIKDVDKIDPYQNEEGDNNEEDNEGYVDPRDTKLAGRNIGHAKDLDKQIPDRDELYREDKVANGGDQEKDNDYDEDDENNDEEYPYYDENLDDKKLRSKHMRDPALHLKPDRAIKRSEGDVQHPAVTKSPSMTETRRNMILIFIGCFVVLFLFMFRFIKKRRIHIRYHTRALFGL